MGIKARREACLAIVGIGRLPQDTDLRTVRHEAKVTFCTWRIHCAGVIDCKANTLVPVRKLTTTPVGSSFNRGGPADLNAPILDEELNALKYKAAL